ncbi:MAG: hypothetical protein MK538_16210, partial [Planctomycetes bacterium]|nr:hypothetical protein [Planctomycetota bacterium]
MAESGFLAEVWVRMQSMLFETRRSSTVPCSIFVAFVVGASAVLLAKGSDEGAEPQLESLFPLSLT